MENTNGQTKGGDGEKKEPNEIGNEKQNALEEKPDGEFNEKPCPKRAPPPPQIPKTPPSQKPCPKLAPPPPQIPKTPPTPKPSPKSPPTIDAGEKKRKLSVSSTLASSQ